MEDKPSANRMLSDKLEASANQILSDKLEASAKKFLSAVDNSFQKRDQLPENPKLKHYTVHYDEGEGESEEYEKTENKTNDNNNNETPPLINIEQVNI